MKRLNGKKVAILAACGFEQAELESPRQRLLDEGAMVHIVSPKSGTIGGMKHAEKGDEFQVDVTLADADAEDYDALVLPGGLLNPDTLRRLPEAHEFAFDFFSQGKPVAAICHGAQTLIDAGLVRGRKMTSVPTIQSDLKNAGATWVDEAVVVDNGFITSRTPADLPQFNDKLVEEILEGKHEGQRDAVKIKKLAELISDIEYCMLTTTEADGQLRSRPMATQKDKFDGELWFFTSEHSGKSSEINRRHPVNVSYANPSKNAYVSASGWAEIVHDEAKAKQLWSPLLKAFFPKGLEDPELALLRVRVTHAEYWDAPSGTMVQLFGMVRAAVTGQPYKSSGDMEHAKVELRHAADAFPEAAVQTSERQADLLQR